MLVIAKASTSSNRYQHKTSKRKVVRTDTNGGLVVQVAESMPDHQFAVVCAWAIKDEHKEVLRTLGNVDLLEPFQNMDELWR